MKVCFFAHDQFIANGATRSMIDLIKKLKESEIDAVVIIRQPGTLEEALKEEGIKYYIQKTCALTVPSSSHISLITYLTNGARLIYNYIAVQHLSRKLKNENIDLVHINKAVGIGGALLARKMKIPYIWHLREYLDYDYDRKFVFKKYVYNLMRGANQIIAISNDVKKVWEERLGIENIVRIYNAVPEQKRVNVSFGENEEIPLNIVMVGAITEGKGQMEALQAVNRLKEMGKKPLLRIVGSAVSYDYEQKIKDYIRENSLERHVEIIPYTKDVYSIRQKSTIGLLCSAREAFGRVTVETMLSGIAFIGSNTGGTPELVEDGVTGYLYEYENMDDLINKITICVKDKEKYLSVINKAFEVSRERFTLESTAKSVKEVYKMVLANRGIH